MVDELIKNRLPQIQHDLEELVTLAEKVSEEIKNIESKLFWERVEVIISVAIIIVPLIIVLLRVINSGILDYISLIMVLVSIFGIFATVYNYRELNKVDGNGIRERNILYELFKRINDLKGTTSPEELGIVAYTTLEIRLSRIQFT